MDEREMKQKAAAFGEAARQLGGHAMQTLGTAVAAGAVGVVGVAAAKLYDAATKSRDYRAMLVANPEVREFATENPNMANAMFTSLRQLNPAYSKDPFVAGHVMLQMARDPGHAGGYLLPVIQDRSKFDQPILETYLKGGLEGIKPRTAQSLPWGSAPGGGGGRRPPTGGGGPPTQGGPPYPSTP